MEDYKINLYDIVKYGSFNEKNYMELRQIKEYFIKHYSKYYKKYGSEMYKRDEYGYMDFRLIDLFKIFDGFKLDSFGDKEVIMKPTAIELEGFKKFIANHFENNCNIEKIFTNFEFFTWVYLDCRLKVKFTPLGYQMLEQFYNKRIVETRDVDVIKIYEKDLQYIKSVPKGEHTKILFHHFVDVVKTYLLQNENYNDITDVSPLCDSNILLIRNSIHMHIINKETKERVKSLGELVR
jgi:hypothetical protein